MAKKMGDKMSAFWNQEQQATGIRNRKKTLHDHIFGLAIFHFRRRADVCNRADLSIAQPTLKAYSEG